MAREQVAAARALGVSRPCVTTKASWLARLVGEGYVSTVHTASGATGRTQVYLSSPCFYRVALSPLGARYRLTQTISLDLQGRRNLRAGSTMRDAPQCTTALIQERGSSVEIYTLDRSVKINK